MIVPIPMSSPTFGTGLVVGGAWFYRQIEEQKKVQPASFTGVACGYTNNKSYFAGAMQQNYWSEDRWRFTGVAGFVDFKLELIPPAGSSDQDLLDWFVKGPFLPASIARKVKGHWYLGVLARYVDITQDLDLNSDSTSFDLNSEITTVAAGLTLEYDTRDKPSNAYNGRRFELKSIFAENSQRGGSSYNSYYARFRSYHQLKDPLVLALDINGCTKTGVIPLWDTCRLGLRGSAATEYLSGSSIYAQVEARWKVYKRWGLVDFAGGGHVSSAFVSANDDKIIPSYGAGIRFMVSESQRINMRLDYGRSSGGSSAWYLSVTEAF